MATVATDKTTKEAVLDMIRKMPDNACLAEIFDAVRLRFEIEQARREIDQGLGIPDEELHKRLSRWLD